MPYSFVLRIPPEHDGPGVAAAYFTMVYLNLRMGLVTSNSGLNMWKAITRPARIMEQPASLVTEKSPIPAKNKGLKLYLIQIKNLHTIRHHVPEYRGYRNQSANQESLSHMYLIILALILHLGALG